MKSIVLTAIVITSMYNSGCSQATNQKDPDGNKNVHVGGRCEGCEAIYESPVALDKLSWIDTLPDFNEDGPRLVISGTIYQQDGKTPAKDVVLYIYHTDQTGNYSTKGNETGWGKRHGYIRGWIKTNEQGQYKFYTLLPAAYPGRRDPAHIHPVIKEPNKNEYWIDEYLFDDDLLLTNDDRNRRRQHGGPGILKLKKENGILVGKRDIILGLNIPDYPKASVNYSSGLSLGSNCPAFDPLHLSGADKGKQACPMCKYGYGKGVMVWFNHANLSEMSEFVQLLESEMQNRGEKNFRVFLVYMNPFYKENDEEGERISQNKIREWCEKQNLNKVAMVWVPSPVDKETSQLYKINTKAKNTVMFYKKRKVTAKWVNVDYTKETVATILHQL
jgi:protocatechuate 3,4-dioxygenase, beta subunit